MRTRIIVPLLLALLTAVLSTFLYFSPIGQNFEFFFHDLWFNIRGATAPPKDVIVVAMDELSYRNLNAPLNQPWPRKLHAELLKKLSQYSVKKVVFDILFLDKGPDSVGDQELAKSLHLVPSYLGVESSMQQVSGAGGVFTIEELLEPYEPFRKAAAGLALVGLPQQKDIIREFLTGRTERTQLVPSLAEAGAGGELKQKPGSRDLINYYGPSRTIPTYSYYQILEEERPFPKEVLEGKTVYVGMALRSETGPSKKDSFGLPFYNGQIFGVEVHATAAANLLEESWIRRWSLSKEGIFIFLTSLVSASLVFSLSPISGAIFLATLFIGWPITAYYSFTKLLFLPGALIFLGIIPAAYSAATLYSFFVTRKSEKILRSAFEMYLAPEMVSQLQQKGEFQLGGQKVWATALFTDIAGFTEISEELPPEKAAEMLNEYFTQVMEVIFQNRGTLIKFIGDAVFVIWGAPVHMDNHAALAVQAALLLEKEVTKFNALNRYPELKTRIGIHTGPMVVGNLGSKKRFDYTAIGDSVNLASRIESLNKYLGTTILISENVKKDAGLYSGLVEVGDMRVKGKKEAIAIYTVFDPPVSKEVSSFISNGLQQFRRRLWAESKASFDAAAVLEKRLGGLAQFYSQYIDLLIRTGVDDGWNGEVDFDHK